MNQNYDERAMLFILLGVFLFIWWCNLRSKKEENFDSTGSEVLIPHGCPQYGLRGDLLQSRDIHDYYICDKRHMVLNKSGGLVWESCKSPEKEGIQNCKIIKCPLYNNYYDDDDKCYMCDSKELKRKIPDIHPH